MSADTVVVVVEWLPGGFFGGVLRSLIAGVMLAVFIYLLDKAGRKE